MYLPPLLNAPAALQAVREGVLEHETPTYPHRVFACAQAELPQASRYTYCQAWVTDANALVVSDGTDWINVATGVSI